MAKYLVSFSKTNKEHSHFKWEWNGRDSDLYGQVKTLDYIENKFILDVEIYGMEEKPYHDEWSYSLATHFKEGTEAVPTGLVAIKAKEITEEQYNILSFSGKYLLDITEEYEELYRRADQGDAIHFFTSVHNISKWKKKVEKDEELEMSLIEDERVYSIFEGLFDEL